MLNFDEVYIWHITVHHPAFDMPTHHGTCFYMYVQYTHKHVIHVYIQLGTTMEIGNI